jgi:tripartite-type tricarboxylate transporter receptor subunit TctC
MRLMRAATFAAGVLSLYPLMSAASHAQGAYPTRTIRLIVPFAAGGLPDTVARIVGASLQERVKQSVVIENRPGSGGAVAAVNLAASPADGYHFIVTDNSFLSINPFIYRQLPYDPREFVPIAQLAHAPLFLAAHPRLPIKTMNEFVNYARTNPGKITYGSSGIGTAHHLSMEAIKAQLKLDMTHVPFRGTGQSVPALLGGHVDALFAAYPSLSGAVESKKVIILATNGAGRSPDAPDVPSVSEFIPGFDFASRISIFARIGVPATVFQRLTDELMAVTREADTIDRLKAVGIEAAGLGADETRKVLEAEIQRVAATVKAAGIEPE